MRLGLRIDVDTLRGTRHGVRGLCRVLASRGVRATFFFSVGPDNMGRHLLRLLRPRFLGKMLRTGAPRLYGWDVLIRGTLGPGPLIGLKEGGAIQEAARQGHEVGLHAWDHYAWQARAHRMDEGSFARQIQGGMKLLRGIVGSPPVASAAPGWRSTPEALRAKARFGFRYNSDCRGKWIFRPLVDGRPLGPPQIPVTLPTYDELVGRGGMTPRRCNDHLLSLLRPEGLNVLTIHAEVEGMACRPLFEEFLDRALEAGVVPVPLGELLQEEDFLPTARILKGRVPGREGWVSVQGPTLGR